jgi:hypothetical protein
VRRGLRQASVAARAGRHIGFDIDESAITMARDVLAHGGLTNAELHHRPPQEITAAASATTGQGDVFLLYAVLEHLSVQERLDVLALARRAVHRNGVIVVCEAPSRLVHWDHHTTQMPFFISCQTIWRCATRVMHHARSSSPPWPRRSSAATKPR